MDFKKNIIKGIIKSIKSVFAKKDENTKITVNGNDNNIVINNIVIENKITIHPNNF